jgi:hypothetical protein
MARRVDDLDAADDLGELAGTILAINRIGNPSACEPAIALTETADKS